MSSLMAASAQCAGAAGTLNTAFIARSQARSHTSCKVSLGGPCKSGLRLQVLGVDGSHSYGCGLRQELLRQSLAKTSSHRQKRGSLGVVAEGTSSNSDASPTTADSGKPSDLTVKTAGSETSSSTPNPFAAGKISSKIGGKAPEQGSSGPAGTSSPSLGSQNGSSSKPSSKVTSGPSGSSPSAAPSSPFSVKPTGSGPSPTSKSSAGASPFAPKPTGSDPFAAGRPAAGQVSTSAAQRLTKATSVKPSLSFTGKKVVDAFREGEKEGKTTKFGQPVVPTNIFNDVRRTKEEIEADKWRFRLDKGQILLVVSFLATSAAMFATVWVVWKLGAIHFND